MHVRCREIWFVLTFVSLCIFCVIYIYKIYICGLWHVTVCRICLQPEKYFLALILDKVSIENRLPILAEFLMIVCLLDKFHFYCRLSKMVLPIEIRVFRVLNPIWFERPEPVFRLQTIFPFVVSVGQQMPLFAFCLCSSALIACIRLSSKRSSCCFQTCSDCSLSNFSITCTRSVET
mgnify:CR=1 FL=1